MSYYQENFLLKTKSAQTLYHLYAEKMPIFDYHCHLSEKELLENKPFSNITELWLGGDHYKWRLMRSYGIEEKYITGDAEPKEKFFAYCKALQSAFGNPLYHWSQVELETFFDCHLEINESNQEKIWNSVNEYIVKNALKPSDFIERSNVKFIFTTNECFDDLSTFPKLKEKFHNFSVYPAFRADKVLNIDAKNYLTSIAKIEAKEGKIDTLDTLEKALENRLKAFIEVGCVASDIAPDKVYAIGDRADAESIFAKVLNGEKINAEQVGTFKGYLTYFLFKLCAKYNISTEFHLGATRNNNSVMFEKLGADTGYDAIGQADSTDLMQKLFNRLNNENSLPKTIIFDLNPKMNTSFAVLMGCFQDSCAKGKMQFGAAWWFNDHKVGIQKQLEDLAAAGHLGTFIGMLTDSRSFLSYPRHQYFRRILCNYLGSLQDAGEITNDTSFIGKTVQDICYNNAIDYFGVK